jgi:glycosyltransferase involved in cell wall biosynthesis
MPAAGSLEIWTHEVARRLADRGHEVFIYASRSGDLASRRHDGIEYRFIDHAADRHVARVMRPLYKLLPRDRAFFSSPAHPLIYWLKASRVMAADRCEAVHVYNYSQALPFVRRANPDATIAIHMQCEWLSQLARGMIARRLARADLVLGCSEYISGKIRRRFPDLGDKLQTLYNGVETGDDPPAAGNGAERDPGVRLLHVGRISPEKGHHVLVDAFNRLVEEHPELSLTCVGHEAPVPLEMALDLFGEADVEALRPFYEGSYLEQVRGRLSERAAERVTFAGGVSYEETQAFYRDADVFVFPSIYEAMPIPPIEAMAAGLPVVATSVGGTVESVSDGETGFLVPRGDADALAGALGRLIADEDLRASFAAAGRRRAVDRFSWTSVCDSFLALFARGRSGQA